MPNQHCITCSEMTYTTYDFIYLMLGNACGGISHFSWGPLAYGGLLWNPFTLRNGIMEAPSNGADTTLPKRGSPVNGKVDRLCESMCGWKSLPLRLLFYQKLQRKYTCQTIKACRKGKQQMLWAISHKMITEISNFRQLSVAFVDRQMS